MYIAHCTLYTDIYNVHCTLYTDIVECAMYIAHYIQILFNVQSTLHIIYRYCRMYNVHCTLYTDIVPCTLHIL